MTVHGRRSFAKILAAAAAGAGVASLPFARRALATPPPVARARRLLVINLAGGVRSSAAFLASPEERFNPWGILPESLAVPLGKVLDDYLEDPRLAPGGAPQIPVDPSHYVLGPEWDYARLPPLREIAPAVSVVATWNEARGDHFVSGIEETTGERNIVRAGLLTRLHMALGARDGAALDVPPFHLAPAFAQFAQAPDEAVRFAPVTLRGSYELPSESAVPAHVAALAAGAFSRDEEMHVAIDRRRAIGLRRHNAALAASLLSMRGQARRLGSRLAEPWLNTGNADPAFRDAAFGEVVLDSGARPLTNAMLMGALSRSLGPDPGDPARAAPIPDDVIAGHPYAQAIADVALSVRLLQLGAPAAVVEISSFDFHSGEKDGAPMLYSMIGRLWGALRFLLARIPDPDGSGQSLLDGTLIVTMSEFGRDPAATRGFNAGEGSDHGAHPSTFLLAQAVTGANVPEGRLLGPAELEGTEAYDGRLADERYGTHDWLATLLDAMGTDSQDERWGFPETGTPIAALWEGA
jgi:hypothetical protein